VHGPWRPRRRALVTGAGDGLDREHQAQVLAPVTKVGREREPPSEPGLPVASGPEDTETDAEADLEGVVGSDRDVGAEVCRAENVALRPVSELASHLQPANGTVAVAHAPQPSNLPQMLAVVPVSSPLEKRSHEAAADEDAVMLFRVRVGRGGRVARGLLGVRP